jgi:hypothetical protein
VKQLAAVLACALACAAWPAAAHAATATAAEVRTLAFAAQRDPAALARLRAIDVVDGRPARLGALLRGSDSEVRGRLRALAQDAAPATTAPAAARERARDVLAQRRFQSTGLPSPLRSVRERIGEALRSAGRPLQSAFEWVAERLPGGAPALAILLAVLALAGGVLLARRLSARVLAGEGAAAAGRGGAQRPSAASLREEAERAERDGDLDEALRLRFRAGLAELDERGLIELRPALTDRELLSAVRSPTLSELVDGFEEVAYGGRPAEPDDVRGAREGWPRVPHEAGAR